MFTPKTATCTSSLEYGPGPASSPMLARYLHFFLVRCDIRLHIMYIVPIHSVTARSKSDVNLTLLGAGSTPLQTTACHPHIIHIGLYCRNIRQPSRMTPIQRSVDPFHARRVHIRAPRDTPKCQAAQKKRAQLDTKYFFRSVSSSNGDGAF